MQGKEDGLKEAGPFVHKSYIAGSVTNKFARESGTVIFVFENTKVDINQRIQEEINNAKKYFQSDSAAAEKQ